MSILSGKIDFFGLDIGSSAIRLVELKGDGPTKTLSRYAYVPIQGNISRSDAPADRQKLAEIIKDLVSKSGVSTKNVAVGLYTQKVFTTVFELDRAQKSELASAIKYQVDSIIPTPINDSTIDWEVIGDSPKDASKIEILLSSITNEYLENLLNMLESIKLNVIAFEPDTMAISRALVSPSDKQTQVILDFGSLSTDLVVVGNGVAYLSRSIPMGVQTMVRSIAQNLNIDVNQANQFLFKFGLETDKMQGKLIEALEYPLESLFGEISKSIKYYMNRYPNSSVAKIVITGGLTSVPGFSNNLATKVGINVEQGNAWRNVIFNKSKSNELRTLSSQFGVAVGLAERANA